MGNMGGMHRGGSGGMMGGMSQMMGFLGQTIWLTDDRITFSPLPRAATASDC